MDIDDEGLIEEWEDDATFSTYLHDSALFSNPDNHGSEKNQASIEDEDNDLDYAIAFSLQNSTENEDINNYNSKDEDNALDYAIAFSLQTSTENKKIHNYNSKASEASRPLSIVDKQWELIDPVPDIHALFIEFDNKFFYGKLKCVEVRWSPRMTTCAGICSYQGRGGLCSIGLSVPLLKLRPRHDLVETLLHEMIHAYLFVTANNKDHGAHGPEFIKHMKRINSEAGTNITVYHNFHDEVAHYKVHWWKCDGPCRNRSPYYGVVKRAMNRAPGPTDNWWAVHQSSCGGKFVKIKEPSGFSEKKLPKRKLLSDSKGKSSVPDIRKFVRVGSPSPGQSETNKPNGLDIKSQSSINQKSSFAKKEISPSVTNSTETLEKENFIPFQGTGHKLGSSGTFQKPTKLSSINLKDLHFERNKKMHNISSNETLSEINLPPGSAKKISPKKDLPFYFPRKSSSPEDSPHSFSSKMATSASQSKITKAPEFSIATHVECVSKGDTLTPATSSKLKRLDKNALEHLLPSISTLANVDHPGEISSSITDVPSSVDRNVYCPVCSNLVKEEINLHLDKCLKS